MGLHQSELVPDQDEFNRFQNLTFEDFRSMAKDETLSQHQKIGFPDTYRQGKEEIIFRDITQKLPNLSKEDQLTVDIGIGCSGLALHLIDQCRTHRQKLILIDSQEMLDHLPEEPFITKVAGYYPRDCGWLVDEYAGKVNSILTYSVFHYIFAESNVFEFLDRSLSLLADGGELLIGDIPNISKRKRFFSSREGIKFHQAFTGTKEVPSIEFNTLETGQIDDGLIVSLILRCRSAGFDAYWLPQPEDLPMANRREDLLIKKP